MQPKREDIHDEIFLPKRELYFALGLCERRSDSMSGYKWHHPDSPEYSLWEQAQCEEHRPIGGTCYLPPVEGAARCPKCGLLVLACTLGGALWWGGTAGVTEEWLEEQRAGGALPCLQHKPFDLPVFKLEDCEPVYCDIRGVPKGRELIIPIYGLLRALNGSEEGAMK